MKKYTLFLAALLFFTAFAQAKPIDEATAKKIGANFLTSQINSGAINLQLAFKAQSAVNSSIAALKPVVYFYAFNQSDAPGYIIVAGDDIVSPILAYSDAGHFANGAVPENMAKWLEGYKDEIRYAIEKKLKPAQDVSFQWQNLAEGKTISTSRSKKPVVNPLLQTTWDQGKYYNSLCPFDSKKNTRTVTGCVATAMAQIMKYWNHPSKGSDFHSYSHASYGTLSANFGSTTYNWSSMPSALSSANNDVATLMYHCGISVDMNYGVASNGGSGAAGATAVAPALEKYFNYATSLTTKERSNYTNSQWIKLIKDELDADRPVYYEGTGSGSGHAFVCDGYDANDYFHFNWGWGGVSDGYFAVSALNPSALGTGGGQGGFNSNQKVVIGIEPSTGQVTYELELSKNVTPSAPTAGFVAPFSVSTNIINNGSNSFTGDYCAAMFDNNGVFVDYIQQGTNITLPAGYTYTNDLVFGTNGNVAFLPGNYKIYMFYRPTGGSWIRFRGEKPTIKDSASIKIVNPNDIELNSDFAISPGTTLTQGNPASVTIDLLNNGSSTFKGDYVVALYNLDGSFAQTIGTYSESAGLPVGYAYKSPYITFGPSTVTVAPGTYLMATLFNPNNTSWKLTGSSNHQNPIKVIVEEAPLLPDKYEINDSLGAAYALKATFSGNVAIVNTTGSTCHTGTDYDYYKIVLPPGYDYTITSRLHDAVNSGNGNTYTMDGVFSYSTDSMTWSDVYDNIMPGDITFVDGGTLYLHVSPYFAGATGTYLLSTNITRTLQPSAEKEITAFTVAGIKGTADINSANAAVALTVTSSTDVTKLKPTITISDFASINPLSGVTVDFTNTVDYTVTAQDGSKKVWAVTVTVDHSTGINDLLSGKEINIYPNPASDYLVVSFDNQVSVRQLSITEIKGKLIQTVCPSNAEKTLRIPLTDIAAGTYFLQIEDRNGNISNREIIVQK